MELRQLRYFLTVAEELHFGHAAELLRMSQPPLSVAVKALETELGVQLFERSTRKVTLTPEGEAFRESVQQLLEGLDTAVTELSEVRRGVRGKLRVGYVSSASYSILPRAVQSFQEQLPLVELSLHPLTSAEQLSWLTERKLDIGIVRDQTPLPGLRREQVLSEQLVAVLPEHHPLAAESQLTAEQLADQPLILFPHDLMPGYLSRIAEVFEKLDAPLNIVQRTVHQETVLGLVAAGVGSSILPASVARITMPGVVSRPLVATSAGTHQAISANPSTELQIVWHGELSSAARVFTDCVLAADATSRDEPDAEW